MEYTDSCIHIAMSKYPLGHEEGYVEKLKQIYLNYKTSVIDNLKQRGDFEDYNEASLKQFEELYEPTVYHMFSQFDVALISLVNNFKFPQRVFEPHANNKDNIKSVSYQILSGSVLASNCESSPFQVISSKNNFLKIIQLKVNNSLLIGNGNFILKECVELIEKILIRRELKDYLFIDSFNWAELILIISDKTSDNIANALMEIRSLGVNNIDSPQKEKIITDSLYTKWASTDIEGAHLFSETHSFLTVNYLDFLQLSPETKFKSLTEWKIKPGHLPYFLKELNNEPFNIVTHLENVVFKTGKTDYLTEVNNTETIEFNQAIFRGMRTGENKLIYHLRRIKTDPFFNLDDSNKTRLRELQKIEYKFPLTESHLTQYKITAGRSVSDFLKKMNISRNIRKKIHKIIYNYNLGIQDSILFIYFIDLKPLLIHFIDVLEYISKRIEEAVVKGVLEEETSKDDYGIFKTKYIERLLESYIFVFEEAIQDRILNNYNYEDINEFNLDINSSLSGIVSSLDAVIKFYGVCFRNKDDNTLVTTINDKETLSNKINVNYNVEHITSPPLIFSTLLKEISNVRIYKFGLETVNLRNDLQNELKGILNEDENGCLVYNYLSYFEADYKKFSLTFFEDPQLFKWWHWAYALQNTHLYNSIGCFSEPSFIAELFRIMLILSIKHKKRRDQMKCPIPELQGYWDKHFNRMINIVEKVISCKSFDVYKEALDRDIKNSLVSLATEKMDEDYDSLAVNVYQVFRTKVIEMSGYDLKTFSNNFFNDLSNSHEGFIRNNNKSSTAQTPFYSSIFSNILKAKKDLKPGDVVQTQLFLISSCLSYYSLNYMFVKFEKRINLLRRDFATGNPISHFLKTEKKWFIDPFGGFFVNDINEMNDYMKTSNKLISLMRHLGYILKKDTFKIVDNI